MKKANIQRQIPELEREASLLDYQEFPLLNFVIPFHAKQSVDQELRQELVWLFECGITEIADEDYEEILQFMSEHLYETIKSKLQQAEATEKQKYQKRKQLFGEEPKKPKPKEIPSQA